MPKHDPEQLARSLAQHRPPICDRIGARHTAHPELWSLARQNREEKIRILEEAAQKVPGSNLRDLRAALARNRKNTQEALSRLRAESASQHPAAQPAPTAKTFRSLKSLGGRTVPFTGQSSFSFLDAPFAFDKNETRSWLWNSSMQPGNVFFQTNVLVEKDSDGAVYTFRYLWNNDSDSAMVVQVDTAVEFTGYLFASAQVGYADMCWDATVFAFADVALDLGTPEDPAIQSETSNFDTVIADNGALGLGDGLAEKLYNVDGRSLSINDFLVLPNSSLVISVSTAFHFWWGFHTPIDSENYAQANFGDKLITGPRVTYPGVAVIASPMGPLSIP
jgi:hypothetical protein